MNMLSFSRGWLLILLAALLATNWQCVSPVCFGDEEEVNAAPEFYNYLARDRTNLFYFADPGPVIQRFLKSKSGQNIMNSVAAGDRSMTAKALLREFDGNIEQFVPDQICMAMSNKSMAGLSSFINVGMSLALCVGAVQSGESEALDQLQKELITALQSVEIEEIDIWVRFRNEFVPTMIESQLRSVVSELTEGSKIDLDVDLNGVGAVLSIKDFVPTPVVSGTLFSGGLFDDLSDPDLKTAGEIIAKKELGIRLTRYGRALHLQIGKAKDKAQEKLAIEEGKLWQKDEKQLFYWAYDLKEVSDALKKAEALWEKYADTPVGAMCMELDSEDLLGEMKDILDVIENGVAGELRITLDDQLVIDGIESGYKVIPSIGETNIGRFVPTACNGYFISTEYSFADFIRGYLTGIEDRLANREMKESLSGYDEDSPTKQVTEFYYSNFKDFRKLIREELPSVFESPVVVVSESVTEPTSLTFNFDFQGEPNNVSITNLPVPRIALIARISDGKDPGRFARSVLTSILKAADTEKDFELSEKIEIEGVDFPTTTLSTSWHKDVLPNDLHIHADGEATLHAVMLPDRWVVLSTSAELTKKVLLASEDPSQRKKLAEKEASFSNVIQAGNETINSTILVPIHVLQMIAEDELELFGEGFFAENFLEGFTGAIKDHELKNVLAAMSAIGKEFGEFRMETQHDNGVRTLKMTFSFLE